LRRPTRSWPAARSRRLPDLAVLVLNWNGARWLEGCFRALLAQEGPAFEAWLVDNGSTDGSVELVRSRFPQARVLALEQNLGFGAAYNRAIEAVECPLAALLNNDTAVQPGWLRELQAELEQHPEAAAAGSKLLFMDRPGTVNHAGGQITSLGAAYDAGWGTADDPAEQDSRECSAATAAAMLVRREAFLDVGGFDESYFAYFEDADLCWRLWLKGCTVRYAPRARALHAYGGTTGSGRASAFRIRHCQTNRLQNMAKNLGPETLARLWPLSLAYDAVRMVGLLRAGDRRGFGAYVQGTRSWLRLLPHVLNERRRVQAMRSRSDAELFRLGVLAGPRQAAREWRRLAALASVT
jgi:GT2 family glycosyltransferase